MDEAYTVVEFLLEDLELIMEKTSSSNSSPVKESPDVISLYENLNIIKSFLERTTASPFDQKQHQYFLLREIRDVALKILEATDSYMINALTNSSGICGTENGSLLKCYPELALRAKQIDLFKKVIMEIPDDGLSSSMETKEVGEVSVEVSSRTSSSSPIHLEEEKMVGFDDEAMALLDRLTGDQKQLEVVSLVGMAGIGKTTLAKRLYNDPRLVYHFHVRGWTCAPAGQEVKTVLYNILSSIILDKLSLHKMTTEEMGVKLYKYLKGKRYLIVIDGLWNSFTSCSRLRLYFPNDSTGSKILITSRIQIDPRIYNRVYNHFLRFLSQSESRNLFVSKVFTHNESCPRELMELGNEVVAKCNGLPLAIVVLAGLAKKDKTPEWWTYIVKNIGSCIDDAEGQFMDILGSSYEHLPNWLKSCFLHLASFPQNYEIPVKKLVRSWIAEGFVKDTGEKELEDVAEDYLKDLIDRSLVVVTKRRSNGGIKTCYIHDLLRYICFKKGKDSKMLWPICSYGEISLFSPSRPTLDNYFFLCAAEVKMFYYFKMQKPSCQCFHSYNFHHVPSEHVNFTHMNIYLDDGKSLVYKLLRVLDLEYIILQNFPIEILQLVHVKYLALWIFRLRYLPFLSNLWNLETFVLRTEKGQRVTLQQNIWKLVKLRHLHILRELEFEDAGSSSSSPSILYNLQTISHVCPSGCSFQDTLTRMPNLIKLGLHLTLADTAEKFEFPDLASLNLLERLRFEYQTLGMVQFCLPQLRKFPQNLKKLTLVGSHLDWKEISVIELLPNLEVLKLKDNFFSGPRWETSDEGFCRLKFLKLSHMNLQQWIASSSSFPCLEQLVLNGCLDLEEMPSSFEEIYTLEIIEVYHSSQYAADAARQIQESQKYMGNDELRIIIHPYFEEN